MADLRLSDFRAMPIKLDPTGYSWTETSVKMVVVWSYETLLNIFQQS